MKYLIVFFTFIGLSLQQVSADEVTDWFSELDTLNSKFTQYVIQQGQTEQKSIGSLLFKKPLFFNAEYSEPVSTQLVSDGKTFYHYDIDLMQVTTKPAEEIANEGLMKILSGITSVEQEYKIASITHEQVNDKISNFIQSADSLYLLTPKYENSTTAVTVAFKEGKIFTISAEDDLGVSVFKFEQPKVNESIDSSEFVFSVPDGVDLLGSIYTEPTEKANRRERNKD